MGDEVKGFIVKREFSEGLMLLSDAQLGAVMRAIIAESNGEVSVPKDPISLIMFKTIMPSIRAAQEAYSRRCDILRENGKKGGRPKKQIDAEREEPSDYSENQMVISENQSENQRNQSENQKTLIEGNRRECNVLDLNTPPHTPPLGGACEGEVIDDPNIPPSKAKGKRPTVADVSAYCNARQNNIDPQAFCDYYAAQGWKLSNGRPMVDWQAAVRTWEQRRKNESNSRVQFQSTDARQQNNMAVVNRFLSGLGGAM